MDAGLVVGGGVEAEGKTCTRRGQIMKGRGPTSVLKSGPTQSGIAGPSRKHRSRGSTRRSINGDYQVRRCVDHARAI